MQITITNATHRKLVLCVPDRRSVNSMIVLVEKHALEANPSKVTTTLVAMTPNELRKLVDVGIGLGLSQLRRKPTEGGIFE